MEKNEQQSVTDNQAAPTPERFAMVAKTMQGLEDILADEIRALPGAENVEPGRRSVTFDGTLETMYRANMQCRTALRILKPICTFTARDPEELYSRAKEFDWGSLLGVDSTFTIDSGAVYSDELPTRVMSPIRLRMRWLTGFRTAMARDAVRVCAFRMPMWLSMSTSRAAMSP